MKRHSLFLALGLVATFALFAPGGTARAVAPGTTVVPTGRFTVTVPERRANVAAIEIGVAQRFPGARVVERRRVLGRAGASVVLVFEMPPLARLGKASEVDRLLKSVGRTVNGDCAEVLAKWAKGKPVNLPIFESDWNERTVRTQEAMTRTQAIMAQAKATGRGQVVAVLDGGFDLTHEFLADHLLPGYDALDNDDDPQDLGNGVNDDAEFELPENVATDRIVGHGTFVASIVLAVAPDVTILPVRVLNDEGWGTDLSVASGISYAVEQGASVINMSLVLPDATPIVRDAVRAASAAGVVVVTASGSTNDGWQSDRFLTRRSICVGATDESDVVAPWTQMGSAVQVFAPGVEVSGALGGISANSYGRWSGVSFAVPFLSAGAAMIRQQHPTDWSSRDVRVRLLLPSAPVRNAEGIHVLWRGRVDLDRSLSSY